LLRRIGGEEACKTRSGGSFNTAPVLVDDLLPATDQEGETTVLKASPEGLQWSPKTNSAWWLTT
jgi:hypothetical protein